MYKIYSHDGEGRNNVELVEQIDDPDIDAWVCSSNHADKPLFGDEKNIVFDSIDDAVQYLVLQDVEVIAASEAWTRKEGKAENGGLNAAGRKSYKKGTLKKPVPRGPRHVSFCKRMKGMKEKLTGAKARNDPNSRINKSLRAWHC